MEREKFNENEFCKVLLEWFLKNVTGHVPEGSHGVVSKGDFNKIASYPKLQKKEIKMFTKGLESQGKIRRTRDDVIILGDLKKEILKKGDD